jgi:hypothetical protein
MKNYFIYQYEDLVSAKQKFKVTTLFIHQARISSTSSLSDEINVFFQQHSVTDKLVVILPGYLDIESRKMFFEKRDVTFVRIPGKSTEYLDKCLVIYEFHANGNLTQIFGSAVNNEAKFKQQLLRNGATIIFKNNGGLVESTPDHHFVFPSNKHCAKFIRTGNVLIHQAEIFFLALQLLKHFDERKMIYCDTSSINVLPYAVFEFRRRFNITFECPTVFSFESYELFESHKDSFPVDALVLISSSTSGNIIDRIINEKRAEKAQIQVIYFLGPSARYAIHEDNIICNLTQDTDFPMGIDEFKTFDNPDKCNLCKDHSRPIQIRSDVFLTVQPKIERHLLSVRPEYTPRYISTFVEHFRGHLTKDSFIKVFFKDNDANADYEIYFDFVYLIEHIERFSKFETALERHINKAIPANSRYLLHLPDTGSQKLAEYIVSKIPGSIKPSLIKLESGFVEKIQNESGTVVIVASCITTGKKLLQISRLMRNHEKLNLVYFIGIYRPINDSFSEDLVNDLRKGKDKSDERPFVSVEKINCTIQQVGTSWEVEKEFFEKLIGNIEEVKHKELYNFVNERLDVLRDNKKHRGLSDAVFLKQLNNEPLVLRKNFAFWNFDNYSGKKDVAQSEVYFTISSVITYLEHKGINAHPSLKQSNYIRNILSPRNFHRFNDGIIQASILRSAKTDYLSYDLDSESSLLMTEFLISIIDKFDSDDGEALLEFMLAIGVRKLKLRRDDLKAVLGKAKACPNKIVSALGTYIYDSRF